MVDFHDEILRRTTSRSMKLSVSLIEVLLLITFAYRVVVQKTILDGRFHSKKHSHVA